MVPRPLILFVLLVILMNFPQTQGVEFHISRTHDNSYDQLLCVAATDQKDKKIYSIIDISIIDFTFPKSKFKVATASVVEPERYVQFVRDTNMKVNGSISRYHANLEISLGKESRCELRNYLCELNFINLEGDIDRMHTAVKAKLPNDSRGDLMDSSDLILSEQLNELRGHFVDTMSMLANRTENIEGTLAHLTGHLTNITSLLDLTLQEKQDDSSSKLACATTGDSYIHIRKENAWSGKTTKDASPLIEVSPQQIEVGLTDELEINCSFSLSSAPSMAALISLIVSRADIFGNTSTELVTINDFSDRKVHQMTSENVTATGLFDAGKQSYLHLQYDYPTERQAGVYRCSAQGSDAVGHVLEMTTDSVNIFVNQPSADSWQNKIQELDMYTKGLEQIIIQMSNQIQNLEWQFSKIGNHTEEFETRIRFLESFEYDSLVYSGHRYYVSKKRYTDISIATIVCKQNGGYLVEITDDKEYNAIRDFLLKFNDFVSTVMIAGTDANHESVWVLPGKNQPLPYLDWSPGQPRNNTKENCLRLARGTGWRMYDWYCQRDNGPDYRYMCETTQT